MIANVPMRLAMKFGVSLARTSPLPSRAPAQRLGARQRLGGGVGAGDDLDQLEVAGRVEEVRDAEAPRKSALRPCISSAMRRPEVFEVMMARPP